MRLGAAWLGAIVTIGPLLGSADAKTTAIGEVVPNLGFKDIRYLRRSLSDLGTHKGLALIFLNTDCPVAKRFLPKLRELNAFYGPKDVQFVGVFCSAQDTVMDIASFALENDLPFPVVKDEENEVCAALGIDRVPQVAVLDGGKSVVLRLRHMLMRFLIRFTKGIMLAIGITLPTPEQEKAVAIVWVVAFFAMIAIILGVGWAVLASISHSMN